MGRRRAEASIPAPPGKAELPADYPVLLGEIKERIRTERVRVVLAANQAMVLLYWDIGTAILARQEREGWGAGTIDRLSHDLREAFPDMRGFSPRNLKYMRAFAAAWSKREVVQEVLAQITWYHNIALLEKVGDEAVRLWYAAKAREEGWSRNVLAVQIESRRHERQGSAVTNFRRTLPPADSDLATQVFKDPYLFDFLGTAEPRTERELEQGLVEHIQRFLLEMGAGFAFVGRQVLLEVGDSDFRVDLLFYHLKLRRYVVVELKAVPFSPAFVGQMNLYLSAVDDLMRHPDDAPTIGLLLCKGKDRMVVEYALRDLAKPLGVADWETRLVEVLPNDLKGSLPTIDEIEAEFSDVDGLEHWPRLGDNLLGRNESRKFHIDVAPDQGDRLAEGFKQAGDATLQAFVESRGSYRHLLLPALDCYRKFLELKLKHILTRINFHYGTQYTTFLEKHNLEGLWRDIKAAFTESGFELDDREKATQDQVERCIVELHGLDSSGTGFRYPGERQPLEVDPYHLHKVMSDIKWYLDAFLDFVTSGER